MKLLWKHSGEQRKQRKTVTLRWGLLVFLPPKPELIGPSSLCIYSLCSFDVAYTCIEFFFFLRFNLFSERGRGRERNIYVWEKQSAASHTPWTGDLACNLGLCSDQESNQQPFGLQAGTQSTELHQPRPFSYFWKGRFYFVNCIFKGTNHLVEFLCILYFYFLYSISLSYLCYVNNVLGRINWLTKILMTSVCRKIR